MKVFFVILFGVAFVECGNLILGSSDQHEMVYHEDIHYEALSYKGGYKYLVQQAPEGRRFQGIEMIDLSSDSSGLATVNKGGVGYSYVHLVMQSEKGKELHYDVKLYV